MLYLKKVEMYGFKSFADKVEMRFDHPITGIVGPNGCGKSNVSDAIRWVLGELSPKNLRGKAMQDLIFNGTDTRKSMSYCEVSLFLDNTTRIFPLDLDEIIISRKLYRSNESEYLINRNVVRLKDIQVLLRSVGLGKEGYSIVGQGRMDAVLSARPEERRAIFEEALGISNFITKRNETNNHLERTKVQMDHLIAVMEEVKIRIPELKRQSTMARHYLEYYDELRLLEINAYIYGYDHASQDKEDGKKLLDGYREECALKETKYAEVNELYDELFHKRNSIDSEIHALRDKQVSLAVEMEKNAGDKNVIQERINSCQRDIASTEQQISDCKQEIENLQQSNDALQTLLQRRKEELSAEENDELALVEKYNALSRKVAAIQTELDNLRQKLEEVRKAIADCHGKLVGYQTERNTLTQRVEQIEQSETEIAQRLQGSAGEEGNLLERYNKAKEENEKLAQLAKELKQQIKEKEYKQFEMSKDLQRKQQAYSGEKGSIEMLKDVANNYKRYQASVQYLMQDAKRDEQLASHVCDVVANLLHVEPNLQVAIEVALGGRLQNIVTETEEDVKYCIAYLKEHDYGRVTFLPVAS
ncbi:MAG: chromosome segregation SMC family protein, partial [Candidatus Fimimonas sp.]